MKFLKRNLEKFIFILFTLFFPILSFGQSTGVDINPTNGVDINPIDPNAGKIINPLGPGGVDNIPDFIERFLVGVLRIGMPIVALAIIYSGFLFVFARGNSEKLTKAKDTLLYTIIGAAILLGSWAIAEMIQNTVLAL